MSIKRHKLLLDFTEFREANTKRCNIIHHGRPWTASDWAVAFAGEAGEACNKVKKLNRITDSSHGEGESPDGNKQDMIEAIGKELADTICYADLLAAHLGIDLGEAIRDKFNEVSDRHGVDIKL